MRGPKLNEGATQAQYTTGERHGTKATAKYLRSSAYKARVVLDLIRGLDVRRADEVLQFTERAVAKDIRKVLASAVANASNPDNEGSYLADADELFVLACFADEGPTLRRFRPRARGRATRIRKRTCHVTIVVARMSDARLAIVQARQEGAGASAAASRRARVERSRQRTRAAATGAGEPVSDETVTDETTDAVQGFADLDVTDADAAATEAAEIEATESVATDEAVFAPGEWPGSVLPDADGNGPETHPIKGNADSMLYHTPDSRYYGATKAEVWFDTEEHAEAAGFGRPATADQDAPEFPAGEWPGSVLPNDDGEGPETHPIKGNADSMLYHTPDSRYYGITKAEVWFDTEEHAEAAGFSKPATATTNDTTDETTDDTDED
jgi:large subunit ribosomal protein L22